MSNKVKAAIIGLGWAGCEHLKGYAENPLSDVVAICDMDQERANQVAQENNVPRTFTDHRQLLEQEDIDVVSIGLPNFLHAPVTIDALNAGKHVLCEKPPARNAEEAIAMAKKQLPKSNREEVSELNKIIGESYFNLEQYAL